MTPTFRLQPRMTPRFRLRELERRFTSIVRRCSGDIEALGRAEAELQRIEAHRDRILQGECN